jgi:mannosyltransferase OCH1-like enzyme
MLISPNNKLNNATTNNNNNNNKLFIKTKINKCLLFLLVFLPTLIYLTYPILQGLYRTLLLFIQFDINLITIETNDKVLDSTLSTYPILIVDGFRDGATNTINLKPAARFDNDSDTVLFYTHTSILHGLEQMSRYLQQEHHSPIPPLVFVSWPNLEKQLSITQYYCVESWKRCSNMRNMILLTDEFNDALVAKFTPQFVDAYQSYEQNIMRVDFARLLALWLFGGVYADADICLFCEPELHAASNVSKLRSTNELKIPNTLPFGVSNDFIIAPPRHPFLWYAMERMAALQRDGPLHLGPFLEVLIGTGPTMLSALLWHYPVVNQNDQQQFGKIIRLHDYGGGFVRHSHAGKSWHRSDGTRLTYLFEHGIAYLNNHSWYEIIFHCTIIVVIGIIIIGQRQRQRRLLQRWKKLSRDNNNNTNTRKNNNTGKGE